MGEQARTVYEGFVEQACLGIRHGVEHTGSRWHE